MAVATERNRVIALFASARRTQGRRVRIDHKEDQLAQIHQNLRTRLPDCLLLWIAGAVGWKRPRSRSETAAVANAWNPPTAQGVRANRDCRRT